jgi:hypothetical protein
MKHDLNDTELEDLLRGLSPATTSPALRQRVAEELRLDMSWLSKTTSRWKPARWLTPLTYAAVGAAAGIAFMSYLSLNGAASGPAMLPVSTISELDDIENEGIRFSAGQVPQQHVKLRSTERHRYIDPRDGSEVIVEYPRVESLVLPVNFQ